MTRFTEEDFDAWLENPITRAVFAHFMEVKEHGEKLWLDKLRAEIQPDPNIIHVERIELRAQVAFIEDMLSLKLGDIQEDEQQSNEVAPARAAKRR